MADIFIDQLAVQAVTTLVTTVITWLTPLMLAILIRVQLTNGRLQRKEASEARQATIEVAAKVQTVAEVAVKSTEASEAQSEKILILADKTHTLVNSKMGLQLTKGAKWARAIANMTHKPEDVLAAEDAELELADHIAKQKEVDAKINQGRE